MRLLLSCKTVNIFTCTLCLLSFFNALSRAKYAIHLLPNKNFRLPRNGKYDEKEWYLWNLFLKFSHFSKLCNLMQGLFQECFRRVFSLIFYEICFTGLQKRRSKEKRCNNVIGSKGLFWLRFWNFKSSLMFSWYHKTFHVKRYVRLHKGTISGTLHIFYTCMVKSLRAIFKFRAQWSAINFCKYFVT